MEHISSYMCIVDWALNSKCMRAIWHFLISRTLIRRADYLLKGNFGRVLCIIEAKRENLDPYDAKELYFEHCKPLILQIIMPSSIVPFSKDIRCTRS